MKKIITFIIIAGILITGTVAYAAKAPANRPASFKELKTELQPKLTAMNENRQNLAKLQEESNTLYKETKRKIKTLMKSKEKLTQVQLEKIKAAIASLDENKKMLAKTDGEILKQTKKMNAARENRNFTVYRASVLRILEIQDIRITFLTKVIADLKVIQAL